MDLRKPFIDELIEYSKTNDKVVFITCDVGFSFLDPLKEVLGDRFLNLGITEPGSMLVAAGLAKSGFKVFIYSMIPFMLFRPFEIVRTIIGCGNLDVTILGVSGSKAYDMLGYSHNILTEDEDSNAIKNIPNLQTRIPTNEQESKTALNDTIDSKHPFYIRL